MSKKMFIVYDSRATPIHILERDPEYRSLMKKRHKFSDSSNKKFMKCFFPCNTDDATVLVACDSLKEARSYKEGFSGGCVYQYDIKGKQLINEKFVEVL